MIKGIRVVVLILIGFAVSMSAAEEATYAPAKVVYDVSGSDPHVLANVLDRVSLLQNIYESDPFEASIVIVLHEGVIPLFSRSGVTGPSDLMQRARSLTAGEVIHFRMCRASARLQGYEDTDIHEFVSMVPMADAEIVRLQNEGYAYIR